MLTSNLGSQYLAALPEDGQDVKEVEPQVMEIVRGPFPPRIPQPARRDHPVPPAWRQHMAPIVDIQVQRVQKLLKDRKITLALSEEARRGLAAWAMIPSMARARSSARSSDICRTRYLLLRGEVPDGSTVKVEEGDGALKLAV
jgi:ATP-dependent Clp protease ATP-binding subunit ClpB